MIKLFGIVAAAILLPATGASAAAPQEAEAKPEKKICKTEKMTGSLTRVRRTCMTRSEWDRLAEGTRRNVGALERDANQSAATQIPITGAGS